MEMSTSSKAEIFKPTILKAGISIALSVAGFMSARMIMAKRSAQAKACPREESINTLCIDAVESSRIMDKPIIEDEILGLRSVIEDLQTQVSELKCQFIQFQDLKEQEILLLELKNMLLLEMAHVKFLDREVLSMEAEKKRFKEFGVEYMNVLEQLEDWKSENRLLERKVKKTLRKLEKKARIIREQKLKIEIGEKEMLRRCNEKEKNNEVVKKLEDEVRDVQMKLDQVQEEKNQLLNKLELIENSVSSTCEIETEGINIEDYTRLLTELEQLQKERATEIKEPIGLRGSNACLRHELMRYREQHDQKDEKSNFLELDLEENVEDGNHDDPILEQNEHFFRGTSYGDRTCSRRRKLVQRLKRWVEGKLDEKERRETKCFGRHSNSDGADEYLHGRSSCSGAT